MFKTTKLTTKRNQHIIAFEGDSITNEIIAKGEYDSNTLAFISDVLTLIKPNVSLDIGANIGNHSLVIAGVTKRLLSFEPIPFLYEVLASNLKLNGLKHATAINVGLSDTSTNAEIFVDHSGNLGSSSISERHGAGELFPISLKHGDDLLREMGLEESIDFIKIDVEGHEAEVIEGLTSIINSNKPFILMEWKSDKTIAGFTHSRILSTMFPDYIIYSLTTNYNKKVHKKGIFGSIERILNKFLRPSWCLSSFESNKKYSNICLVPPRHKQLFERFPYLAKQ